MITVSQIANANRGELLCRTYELLIETLQQAKDKEEAERKNAVHKALQIIQILVGDLDFSYELASELMRIYIYIQGLLVYKPTNRKIEEAIHLIDKINKGYKQIASTLEEEGVMKNVEAIYSGLTYTKQGNRGLSNHDLGRGYTV